VATRRVTWPADDAARRILASSDEWFVFDCQSSAKEYHFVYCRMARGEVDWLTLSGAAGETSQSEWFSTSKKGRQLLPAPQPVEAKQTFKAPFEGAAVLYSVARDSWRT